MPTKPSYEELENRILELERREFESKELEKEHLMLLELVQFINDTDKLRDLLDNVIDRLRYWSGCEAVAIRLREGPDFPYFATSGLPAPFVEQERHLCQYDEKGIAKRGRDGQPVLECMCGNILQGKYDPSKNFFTTDGSFWSNCTTRLLATTTDNDRQARTRNRCNSSGYESVALIPIRSAGETFGLIQFNDHRESRFTGQLIARYRRFADYLAGFLAKREAREALQKSEMNLRTLINTLPDLVWMKDPEGVFLSCNHRFERFFGAREAEIIGHTDYDFLPEKLADFFRAKDEEAIAAGKPCVNEEEVTFADDGHHEFLETIKTPIFDQVGKITGVLGISRDITPRKQAELMLKESEEQLRLFIKHTPAAMAMFDRNMRYLAASTRWITDYRLEGRDIMGRSHYEVFPEIPEHCKEAHRRGMRGEVSRVDEDYFERSDGNNQWLLWEVRPWFTAGNDVGGIILLTEDITKRKHAENERNNMREQLIQSQKMESVGRLAGGVAHDLNNLLSPILGYSEMMFFDLASNDDRRKTLQEIHNAGTRARDLVRQLLAFSRKQTLETKVIDINEIIRNFSSLLQRMISEDIEFDLALSADILPVRADVGQIEQVLLNLVVNASDAMPNGGLISIKTGFSELDEAYVATHNDAQPGLHVVLSISDTGVGMDKETQDHVFEPFFTTKGEGGTGLGLATVFGIIKQHEGNIWVYSEPGSGTIFKIYLPPAEKAFISEKETRKEIGHLIGNETILLVEDNEQVRQLARAILVRQGYKVISAGEGKEAQRMLASYGAPVHLLLTDVVMPGMNGRQLYTTLSEKHPHLKVLYSSGYANNVIAHRGILEEGIHFIQKPFSNRTLAAKVREVLDGDD